MFVENILTENNLYKFTFLLIFFRDCSVDLYRLNKNILVNATQILI